MGPRHERHLAHLTPRGRQRPCTPPLQHAYSYVYSCTTISTHSLRLCSRKWTEDYCERFVQKVCRWISVRLHYSLRIPLGDYFAARNRSPTHTRKLTRRRRPSNPRCRCSCARWSPLLPAATSRRLRPPFRPPAFSPTKCTCGWQPTGVRRPLVQRHCLRTRAASALIA